MNYYFTQSSLRDFFRNRAGLFSLSFIEKECKLPQATLHKFIKGKRNLTLHHLENICAFLLSYGINPQLLNIEFKIDNNKIQLPQNFSLEE